jgi:hypothetical protein
MNLRTRASTLRCYGLALASAVPLSACAVLDDGTGAAPAEPTSELTQGLTGTWTALAHAPPAPLDTCVVLTDGGVMCHEYGSNRWHRLRPDAFGSYQNGTWDAPAIAPMPNGTDPSFGCAGCTYAPTYFSSAVLPDGRVVVIGGEYNGGAQVWTNIGFLYDPVANTWSSQLTEAFGGGNVGDAQGLVLPDGRYVLTNINNTNMEVLNPATGVFTALNPAGKLDQNDEENWTLLYDGTVLTVDSRIASSFERYSPGPNTWGNAGATPVNLADTGGLPVGNSKEVGPCMQRPDNKIACFSGNALGQNAIYDPGTNTWSHAAAMDFPAAPGGGHFAMADGAAAALPNGNVLVMASPVTTVAPFNKPSHFYELGLGTNTLTAVTDSPNAASFKAYQGRMVVLPTGEVLLTAYDQVGVTDVMLYSNGGAPPAAARPTITAAPATIAAGGVYTISGNLFNGFSEGAGYGDDAQAASNYPLVRITNTATSHVYYARTFNHSRMGVEPTGSVAVVTTSFQVPTNFENGPAVISVVANGIASLPRTVNSKFTTLTLQNGWTHAPFSTEDAAVAVTGGIVQLKGAIATAGTNAAPFILPAGARPSTTVYVPADLFVANTGRLVISPSGAVSVMDEGGGLVNAAQFTSLEGVSFAIDAVGFTPLTLINGWSNAPFATRNAAVKNDGGIIRFEGAIATAGASAVPFVLPIGFRPPTATYIPIGLCNAKKGRLFIQPDGTTTVVVESGDFTQAQCFTSLEGATFALSAAGFTPASLQNGWVNAPFATRNLAFKNDDGTLRLEGAVSTGAAVTLFTLPPELRPARNTYVNVDLCSGKKGRIYALPDGTVNVQATVAFTDAQCFTSLEGVALSFGI